MSVRLRNNPIERTLYLEGFFKGCAALETIKARDFVMLIVCYSFDYCCSVLKVIDAKTVVLNTNPHVRYHEVLAYVNDHIKLIRQRLEFFSHYSEYKVQGAIPQFKHNDTVFLFDKPYVVRRSTKIYRSYLEGDQIFISALNDRREGLLEVIGGLCRTYMDNLTAAMAELYGFSYTRIGIIYSNKIWGNCSIFREINFNICLAFLPTPFTEYVALHELCHTRQMNHEQAFWDEVSAILPDFKEVEKLGIGFQPEEYYAALHPTHSLSTMSTI